MTSLDPKSNSSTHFIAGRGLVILLVLARAQATKRKIVSDDFTKNRQETTPATANKASSSNSTTPGPKPHRTYRLASKPATKTQPSSSGSAIAQLGVTIWRLRLVEANDSG